MFSKRIVVFRFRILAFSAAPSSTRNVLLSVWLIALGEELASYRS